MHLLGRWRIRHGLGFGLSFIGALMGAIALFTVEAGAALAVLTPGHAYCYYFSGPGRSGGMHLVAAGPTVIGAGPSNYISGMGGKSQDTVFYIDCISGAGRVGGDAYIGLPRIVLHHHGSAYSFDRHFVIGGIEHLGTRSHLTSTVTLAISGTVAAGVINGTVHVAAPGCLAHPLVITYAGT